MRVAVITVGDELLAGDTVNTNAAWLGRRLDERGVRVERAVTIPDRIDDIATEVNEARAAHDAVIVTGGVGPTHDDVTMDGVAAALGVPVDRHDDAVAWFEDHAEYSHADLVDGTADLPAGARMVPNPEGVAPGAVLSGEDGIPVYVFPGVPGEMKAMFETVAGEFSGISRARLVIETPAPESSLIEYFEAVRERFSVSLGSYPGENVRIKIEGEDEAEVDRAAEWLRERIETV
jgi:molybdenum cofactor synthesis domain-containing protein